MGTWREYREDFAEKWRRRGYEPYLCDGSFGASALGHTHWHEMVPRTSEWKISWIVEQLKSAES